MPARKSSAPGYLRKTRKRGCRMSRSGGSRDQLPGRRNLPRRERESRRKSAPRRLAARVP